MKQIKDRVKHVLVAQHKDLFSDERVTDQEIKRIIGLILEEVLVSEKSVLAEAEKAALVNEILNELFGFGPIQGLLNDPEVTEVMINGPKKIFAEKKGRKELTGITFESDKELMHIIQRQLSHTRRHVDESNPYTEIVLKDGSRMNIVISPLALNGPAITIRKFLKDIETIDHLINLQVLDRRMADFLIASVKAKINMVFSGPTGSGKTTNLSVLSSHISTDERIITIEDTAELYLSQPNVVRLEARKANIEGKGEVAIGELFRNSLRMRPDRIIIGEIRGNEALDMLQAICSGHKGSLAILHSNSPQDVIYRLENMILSSGMPLDLDTIHRQIAAALNIIVQHEQLSNGSRKITHITQVNGLRNNEVFLEDIFVYEIENIDEQGNITGRWKATGIVPIFYPLYRRMGVTLPESIFNKD